MATTNFYYPLITASQVKSIISLVNNNISNDYIEYVLKEEQQKNLRPLLGYSFYNEIQEQVSGSSLTTENELIYEDYLKMILALYIHKSLIVDMTYQLNNDGLRIKYNDNSSAADTAGIKLKIARIQDSLDYWKSELVKYLCDNQTKYPLYFYDTDDRYNSLNDRRTRGGDVFTNMIGGI